jgi:ArsR family metal-binding transcriptional regulator
VITQQPPLVKIIEINIIKDIHPCMLGNSNLSMKLKMNINMQMMPEILIRMKLSSEMKQIMGEEFL